MERVRAPGRARGRRRHQQARGLGTYKGTGNRNPFHIISGLDGRSRGTRKELVSISTVAAPDFVADALGLPRKAPVILMERFAGLTPERFTKGFLEDDTLYKFYDREFGIGIIRQKCKVRFERVAADAAAASTCPRGSRCCARTASPTTSRRNPSSTASTAAASSAHSSPSTS